MAKSGGKAYEFAMGFVSSSDKYRRQFTDKWMESLANFMVEPQFGNYDLTSGTGQKSPYYYNRQGSFQRNKIILKDFETHAMIMTYAAKLMRAMFGDGRGEYIQTEPVGWEDATTKAPTVTKLLKYALGLPGHYRQLQEGVVSTLLVGTGVFEIGYRYSVAEMPVRSVESRFGVETSTTARYDVPHYDDVTIRSLDPLDFYPDPGRYLIQEMAGAAKRFRMNGYEAMRMAKAGIYDMSATKEAISGGHSTNSTGDTQEDYQRGISKPAQAEPYGEFKEMIGYEYWGEVPWEDETGSSRRVITILNNVVVRDDPYPYADPYLPFHTMTINPMQGRFYGISPAEVVRFDQSFADAVKILLAEAIIRQVHPPIAYDADADMDISALKAWKADALVGVRGGPQSIGTLHYGADINSGFAMLSGLKQGMQQGGGALGAVQGEAGPNREAASVGSQRLEFAMDRLELAARLIEEDCLPCMGKAILRRYQQFITDTDDLKKRVGELPDPGWIGDIMGDFDVRFVGSRVAMSRPMKMQAIQTLAQLAAVMPAFQMMLPSGLLAQHVVGDLLELPEIAAAAGGTENVVMNTLLAHLAGGGMQSGNGNGEPPAQAPPGMMPAQTSGVGPVGQ